MNFAASSRPYRAWVLALFTLVYALNFIDRQIVTVLAPSLKVDLGLADAQVGLLFGTAFALFYALFGLPLAKLADGWHRVATLTAGLVLWSAATALSGLAGSFAALAVLRVGVGVGEASAAPAAMSVLADTFPTARRATALAIYASGIYLGAGASLAIGGQIVAGWNAAYPGGAGAPFAFHGWQVAYLAVGLPGLLLAALVALTVREPARSAHPSSRPRPFRDALAELATLVPPFSFFALRRLGASRRALAANLLVLGGCITGAALLVRLTDALLDPAHRGPIGIVAGIAITTNLVQWSAVALGVYAVASWLGALGRRDPVAAALMPRTPSFVALVVAGGVLSFGSYGLLAFLVLYGKTYVGLGPEAGLTLGAIGAIGGGIGTTLGGILADAARARHPAGRIHVAVAAVVLSALANLVAFTSTTPARFFTAHALATTCLTMWLGPVFATCQEHVPPRLRGTAIANAFLGINLIGLGLGPYCVGLLSDASGSLRLAMLAALLPTPLTLALFLYAARRFPAAQASVVARAVAAGEPG